MSGDSVLDRPNLVLNRRWLPIRTARVREAIGLVAKGAAVIRSPRLALVPPEVIIHTVYEGPGGRSVVFSRKNLFKRDR
jgi:hypothetical protein